MKLKTGSFCLAAALSLLLGSFALGQGAGPVITVDELGNSNFHPGFISADPGPGGLGAVMTYPLPFAGTPGDVQLVDGPVFLDVVRFNGNGTLLFYSDNTDGFDAPADTPSPPRAFYGNLIAVPEVGTEFGNGAIYTPLPGQPGWDPSFPTYNLISDVPEPATLSLLAIGAIAFGLFRWARNRRSFAA